MYCLFNKSQSNILTCLIIVLLLISLALYAVNSHNSQDSLKVPLILATQYQLELFGLEPTLQDKINLKPFPGIISLFLHILLVCIYNSAQNSIYTAYESLNISRLFIIKQMLLLPRQNSGIYKAPLYVDELTQPTY